MRPVFASVLMVGLSVGLCVCANAATVHRARSHVTADPGPRAATVGTPTKGAPRLAVPGWSDEDTRRWMDNASALWQGA
jgi:hypothetical protein